MTRRRPALLIPESRRRRIRVLRCPGIRFCCFQAILTPLHAASPSCSSLAMADRARHKDYELCLASVYASLFVIYHVMDPMAHVGPNDREPISRSLLGQAPMTKNPP
uniref:Uncharacterized protein n=1 Tax=Arundo donax TaxID=35708 RepID=A0A0A9GS81_ARUDO